MAPQVKTASRIDRSRQESDRTHDVCIWQSRLQCFHYGHSEHPNACYAESDSDGDSRNRASFIVCANARQARTIDKGIVQKIQGIGLKGLRTAR